MSDGLSRRAFLRALGASGATAGLVSAGAMADPPSPARPARSKGMVPISGPAPHAARLSGGKVIQPQRELGVLTETDVLVVGGGPAGVAAAVAASRTGAKVALVERYGHFGGLWTGGLVLLVLAMHAKGEKGRVLVTRGIGKEMIDRLAKMDRGVINWRDGVDPTVDAEALKYLMVEMVLEAKVETFLHCWGVDAIVEGSTVRGAVLESKSGRQAVLAKVVIDATGDGDIFAAAGCEHIHKTDHHIGLVCRIGNVDKVDHAKAKAAGVKRPRWLGSATPIAGVNWVNMHGPGADGLSVKDLSRLELAHRRQIWKNVQAIRKTPGYEKVYLLETAPQMGVRITRLMGGRATLHYKDIQARTKFPDAIAVGGSSGGKMPGWQIRYGTLVSRNVENILAAGRCISTEQRMLYNMRLIPTCLVTGHAAGVAAALAVKARCGVRSVEIPALRKELTRQGAYLG